MKIGQSFVEIDVYYFNDKQKNLFSNYKNSKNIDKITNTTIKVPVSEFLTYFLYWKRRPSLVGWRTYSGICRMTDRAISELTDFIEFNGRCDDGK